MMRTKTSPNHMLIEQEQELIISQDSRYLAVDNDPEISKFQSRQYQNLQRPQYSESKTLGGAEVNEVNEVNAKGI